MKCKNCGGNIEIDLDNLQANCPYCGEKILFDVTELKDLLIKKEETKQIDIQEQAKTERLKMEQADLYKLIKIFITFVIASIIFYLY